MRLDGARAQHQSFRDLVVGSVFRHQREHFAFARGLAGLWVPSLHPPLPPRWGRAARSSRCILRHPSWPIVTGA